MMGPFFARFPEGSNDGVKMKCMQDDVCSLKMREKAGKETGDGEKERQWKGVGSRSILRALCALVSLSWFGSEMHFRVSFFGARQGKKPIVYISQYHSVLVIKYHITFHGTILCMQCVCGLRQ